MKKIIVLAVALSVTACANSKVTQNLNPSEMVGAAVGAMIGGYAGGHLGGGAAQVMFTLVGGAVGAATGYSIASQLVPSDITQFRNSAKQAMENLNDGELQNWTNPSTGVAGTIKPIRSYHASQNAYCRDFEATIAVKRNVGETTSRACRVAGGPWLLEPNV